MPKTEEQKRAAHADYMREYSRKRMATDPEYKQRVRTQSKERRRQRKIEDPAYKSHLAERERVYLARRRAADPEFKTWSQKPENAEENREYKRLYARRRYLEPEYKAQVLVVKKRTRSRSRKVVEAEIQKRKDAGCALCFEPDPAALSFHHLDPSTKRFTIGESLWDGYSLATMQGEMDKCVVICENCHRKIHAGLISLMP